jgi:hypothetical protein
MSWEDEHRAARIGPARLAGRRALTRSAGAQRPLTARARREARPLSGLREQVRVERPPDLLRGRRRVRNMRHHAVELRVATRAGGSPPHQGARAEGPLPGFVARGRSTEGTAVPTSVGDASQRQAPRARLRWPSCVDARLCWPGQTGSCHWVRDPRTPRVALGRPPAFVSVESSQEASAAWSARRAPQGSARRQSHGECSPLVESTARKRPTPPG